MTKAEFAEALKEARAEDRKTLMEALKETLSGFWDEKKPSGAPSTKEDLKEIIKEVLSESAPAQKEEPKKLFGFL